MPSAWARRRSFSPHTCQSPRSPASWPGLGWAGLLMGIVLTAVLVLAPLVQLLPGKLGEYAHAYLPTEAGIGIGQALQHGGDLLRP